MSLAPITWPRRGACGACGRPAIGFPSGRWEHVGVPCRARSQSMWWIDDFPIMKAVRFVPEGEPLPPGPSESHWHPTETNADGIPVALGWCRGGCIHSVREALAAEAEEREAANT
jgi:hypothetical protein